MNPLIIPPSPSWYLSKVINSRSDGTIAYGARHEVVIIKCKNEDYSFENFEMSFIPLAHKDRINSLVFSHPNSIGEFKNSLVTCSDDGSVRIWDFETKELKLVNTGHQDGQKVVDVDWSTADPSLVVSVADSAVLISWDILSNVTRRLNLGFKINPICLAACPHDKNLVAVGAKSGIILLVSLKGSGAIQSRMRSHESDIVSLSWCPVKHNIFQENKGKLDEISKSNESDLDLANGNHSLDDSDSSKKESKSENDVYLLASGSKDRIIYFWRAGTDCRYESFVYLPVQQLTSGIRRKPFDRWDKTCPSTWICLKWIDPYRLISGSNCGELLEWDLTIVQQKEKSTKEKKAVSKAVKAIHGIHSKGLFCIACPSLPSRPSNENENRHVWSTAVDKKLVCTSLKTGNVTAEITTIGGIVYCMSVSPLDPNRIAIGIGDAKILIWNMASEKYSVSVFWQRVNGKVMALEWHPTEDNWLAFGTGEGRVGLFDLSTSKPPIIFRQHHRRSVYRLCWAPHVVIDSEKQLEEKFKLALFSVGDGDVLQMSVDNPEKDPVNLKDKFFEADQTSGSTKALGRTDLLWNFDRSILALGNDNGVVYIFDGKTLVKQHIICAHKKIVQSLKWHPTSVSSDASGSSLCKNWLATASDVIKVFDVQLDSSKEVAVFDLQKEKIVDVSWSPHINGRLVSVSYDYTVQVWDVINKAPLVSYLSHHNAVFTALWSPLDPDLIISGSSDNTLRVWRVSEQTDDRPTEKRKTKINNRLKKMANVPEAIDVTQEKISAAKPVTNGTIAVKSEPEIIKEVTTLPTHRIKGKSLFPVTGTSLNLSKHVREHYKIWKERKYSESKTSDETMVNGNGTSSPVPVDKELGYLDFFFDSTAMRRLLKTEEVQLAELGHQSQKRDSMLWRGDVTEMIQEAIQKKQLTSDLVAMAPMASMRIWKDACAVFAEQLSSQGQHMAAASYLIAIQKVEEAVQLLADHKLYREALALAKCWFPSYDPLVKSVMNDFANYSLNNGQLHLAAHCFLSLDEPLIASQALARCKDLSSLRLATLLAQEANAHDIAINLAKNCFRIAVSANEYNTCKEILDDHPELKFLNVWANANKHISESARPALESQLAWIKGKAAITKENSETIIERIRKDAESHSDCYEKMTKNITSFIQLDTEKQLWLFISYELSLAGSANSNLVSLRHVVKAMASAHKFQTLNGSKTPLFRLCMMLFPKGPLSRENLFGRKEDDYEEKERLLLSSINSYLFAGVFGWLSEDPDCISKELKDDETKDFEWLRGFVSSFRFDLFNSKNLEYFKNLKTIEDLEHKIALSKCVKTNEKIDGRVILTAVRREKRKSNSKQPSANVASDECNLKNDANAEGNERKTDCVSEPSKEKSVPDHACSLKTRENAGDGSIQNGDKTVENLTNNIEKEKNSDEIKLSSIKEFNLNFESERISVPNPFSSFYEILNVVQSLTKDHHPELLKVVECELQEAWKKGIESK